MKKHKSDTFLVYLILALSGGCMDAYSYLVRGEVFANAQTGNMLLFGVHLTKGEFIEAYKYFLPILAFVVGIILADILKNKCKNERVHWRQIAMVAEFIMLFVVCLMPLTMNNLANALISLACGIQVESFRNLEGNAIATTMCIGNLRSGTFNLNKYVMTKNPIYRKKAFTYYVVILFFILGAILESMCIRLLYEKSIVLSVILLLTVCVLMWEKKDYIEDEEELVD